MRNFLHHALPKMMLLPADHGIGALTPVADVSFGDARYAAIMLVGGDMTGATAFDVNIQSASAAGGSYSTIQTEESTPADLRFDDIADASSFENAITVGILPLWELDDTFFQIAGTVAGGATAMCIVGIGYDFQDLPPAGALTNVWSAQIGVLARAT